MVLSSPGSPACLALMPMYAGFEQARAAVAAALARSGVTMHRLEVEIADSAWHRWLLDAAHASDLVLADLTGHNPFVMYELGYAHARRLPAVYIVDAAEERIPATVRGAACIAYSDGQLEDHLVDDVGALLVATSRPTRAQANAGRLFRLAGTVADRIDHGLGDRLARVDASEFRVRLAVAVERGAPDPAALPRPAQDRCLLSLLLADSDRVDVMKVISARTSEPGAGRPAIG